MRIVIIEDEKLTAQDLANVIKDVMPTATVEAILYSVADSKEYFSKHSMPDLIFSDIQLGDGLSFDIFSELHVNRPIIFCTAYDTYMQDAFRINGIEYLLKPFSRDSVKSALDKFHDLAAMFLEGNETINELKRALATTQNTKPTSILVYNREKIIPIRLDNVAVFYLKNRNSYLKSFTGETYFVNKPLNEISMLCGDDFFRANRQVLINRKAVKNASHHLSRRFLVSLTIPFDETITISKQKLNEFLDWLTNK